MATTSPASTPHVPISQRVAPRLVMALAAAALVLPTPALAQGTWNKAKNGPLLRSHRMAYDAARMTMVMFGGTSRAPADASGATWTFEDGKWKMVSDTGPAARCGHEMVYDSAREVVVLFGGSDCNVTTFSDTWEWNGVRWREVAAAGSGPPGRTSFGMAYDSRRGVSVLYGGWLGFNMDSGETWEWDGKVWRQITIPGPDPARNEFRMAYDAARGVTVLFGGVIANQGGSHFGETWVYDGERWRLASAAGPERRASPQMAYDDRRDAVILYGGQDADDQGMSDTWQWNGTSWSQVSTSGPSARFRGAAAYDPTTGSLVIQGGDRDTWNDTQVDTWMYGPHERDMLVVGSSDYDGDGTADPSVYSSATKRWKIDGLRARKFGRKGAIPVPGDYDGDGSADAAFFLARKGLWKVRGQFRVRKFGRAGDIATPGDYDGNGTTDLAFFRPSTGTWHIHTDPRARNGGGRRDIEVVHGQMGDLPVPGDYDGDGTTDVAVYRPSSGEWLIEGQAPIRHGGVGTIPVPADYDGDGTTDPATWHALRGKWDVRGAGGARFGELGDVPVPGDYDGDGSADFAVYDPATGIWKVRRQFDLHIGAPGDLPLVRGH